MKAKYLSKIILFISSIVPFVLFLSADNPCEQADAIIDEMIKSFSNYLHNIPVSRREIILQKGHFEIKATERRADSRRDFDIFYMLENLPLFYSKLNLDYSADIKAIKLSKRNGLFICPYYLGAGGSIDCSYIIFPKDDRFESMRLGHAARMESLDKDEEDEIISVQLPLEFDFEKCQPSNAMRPWWINIFHLDAERGRLVDVSNKFPKYYESMLPAYKKDYDTFWSNTKCREEFKQLIKKIESMANIAEDNNSVLIESLKELMKTSLNKIESDINLTATAFADARNIQRSLKWADIFGAALNIVTGTINTISSVISLKDPFNAISAAFLDYKLPLQIFSGFLTIDSLRQSGEQLQLAFDGPAYDSNVKKMLEEAYKESSTKLFFNFLAFQTTIKNYILGLYGTSPVVIPHKSSDLTRTNIEIIYGADKVQSAIRNRLRSVIDKLGENRISSEKQQEINGQIEKARKALLRSKLHGTNLKYKTYQGNAMEIWLGNIGEFEKARLEALTNLDKRLEREEKLTVTKAVSGATNAIKIFLVPTNPALGKAVGAINQILILPSGIDLSERIMKATIYKTNPREQINMIPQEMLLALSKEISDVWMLADDMANYIENQFQPKEIEQEKIFFMKDKNLWSMNIDGTDKNQLTFLGNVEDFEYAFDKSIIAYSNEFAICFIDREGNNIQKIYKSQYSGTAFSLNRDKFILGAKDAISIYLIKEGSLSLKENLIREGIFKYACNLNLSPDGEKLVFVLIEGGGYAIHHIYVYYLKSRTNYEVGKAMETYVNPLWSPDGQYILYNSLKDEDIQNGLYIYDINSRKTIIIDDYGEDQLWSPSGKQIVYLGSKGIYVINLDGSGKRLIISQPKPLKTENSTSSFSIIDRLPQWSLDGRKIIFNRYYNLPEYEGELGLHSPEIWIVDSNGSNLKKLTEKGCYLGYPDWGD